MHLKNFFRQIQVRVPIILNLYHQNQSQISPEPKEERRNRRNSVQVTGKVGSRKQIETRDPLLSCPSLLRVTRSAARLIITKAEQGQHSLFRKSLSAPQWFNQGFDSRVRWGTSAAYSTIPRKTFPATEEKIARYFDSIKKVP
jgi:hypothetical protein